MITRIIVFILILAFHSSAKAQADSLQKQINEQVWRPFVESFGSLDVKGFMAVHSKEMTRVIQDANLIYGYERYFQETERGNEAAKKSNRKQTLELRFIQRIAAADKAFEVGYYKYTGIQPDGSSRYGYGKFHVLLRRENGTWKILMDADASEKTNEAIFQSAKPME